MLSALPSYGQRKKVVEQEQDSTKLFKGIAVSVDAVGIAQQMFGDYGQYEVAARLNLKDKWFPIIELGLGKADAEDDIQHTHFKTSAPYFKIGMDWNLLRRKHDPWRLYAGLRYAYTSYKYDVWNDGIQDPVFGGDAPYHVEDMDGYYHWAEGVFGTDVTLFKPVHLGWSIRYRKRLAYKNGEVGNSWYVPGFGKQGNSRISATFNIIIELGL